MVLPTPAADDVAADVEAWLGKLARAIDRSQGTSLVLLRDATAVWLGPVVRRLSPSPPWAQGEKLHVCSSAPEIVGLAPGTRVLLRVRPKDATWLNLYRPHFTGLRTVLWADTQATDVLQGDAPDFASWINRVVEVPAATLPGFAVEGMQAALAADGEIAWHGPLLERVLRAAGWAKEIVELDVEMGHGRMVEALDRSRGARGLPVFRGVRQARDTWRVRMALAHAGRSGGWVARDPAVPLTWVLETRQCDWDEATQRLREAGLANPGLLAAWLDLQPSRIDACVREPEALRERASLPIEPTPQPPSAAEPERGFVDRLRALGDAVPEQAFVQELADGGFVDVAIELATVRWQRAADRRADDLVGWLLERGRSDEARRIVEQWLQRAQTDADLASQAAALVRLGDIEVTLGKGEVALRHFEDSLAIRKPLAEHEPERVELQRDLSVSLERLGDLHRALGDSERALRCFEDSLAIRRQLAAREPERRELQRDVSVSFERLGSLHRTLGNTELALRYFEDSLAIARRLAEHKPEHANLQRDLSISFDRLGDLHRALGSAELALRYFEDSLAIRKQLIEREPTRTDLLRDLSVSLNKLGDLQRALFGNYEGALRYFEDSLAIRKQLVEREPARADLLRDLSVSFNKLGELQRALGDGKLALRYFEDSLAIARRLAERDPGRLDLLRDLSVSYDNLGELQRALGDRDAARRYFEDSLVIDQQLAEREPGRSDLQRDLAISFERMAAVEPERAADWLARSVETRRRLCARTPGDIGTRCELGIALVQLGYAAKDTDALTEGHALLRELRDRGLLEARYHALVDQLTELLGAT